MKQSTKRVLLLHSSNDMYGASRIVLQVLDILINAKWAKKGFLHFWIDGKLRTSYFGDTMVGASSARFKFGPYRHHMDEATDAGLKIPDTVIRYSNVGKADSCDDLWSGCSDIISQLSDKSQVHGAKNVALCGGVPGKSFCRNLNYPQNQRPF